MRRYTNLGLVLMLALFGGLLYRNYQGDAVAAPGAPATGTTTAAANVADKSGDKLAEKPAEKPAPLARAVKTVALGWEYLAPGALVDPSASFAPATTMTEVEAALAKGGGEAGGADLAIVPLSAYVASYERLRALQPEITFVVGWSRGREVVYADNPAELARLATSTGPVKVYGTPGRPETLLALAVLDLDGVAASRVTLVEARDADDAALTAVVRGAPMPGKVLVSSADMPRLMPIVVIAPHGFVQAHGAELETWGTQWLAGVAKLQADVPAGARVVAGMKGAPPAIALVESFGQFEPATLRDNAVAMGLAGRGALTLERNFRLTWQLWRDTGVLTTPPPDAAPLATSMVAALVRAQPTAAVAAPPSAAKPSGKRATVLLVVPAPKGTLDADAFIDRIGLVAAIFDRLPLRIGVLDGPKAATSLTDRARDRYGLTASQLVTAKRPAGKAPATIEVLAP